MKNDGASVIPEATINPQPLSVNLVLSGRLTRGEKLALKIKNHVVTRGYLARWAVRNEKGQLGNWYFDLQSRQIRFSQGLKASFAISEGIYAPYYAGDVRDDRLENWFAEKEVHLCNFLRKWSSEKPEKPNVTRLREALTGCISLGYRSEHSIEMTRRRITENTPGLSADEVAIKTLNSVYENTLHSAERFAYGFLMIVHNLARAIPTNDQPFTDYTPSSPDYPIATFFAGPRTLMLFIPGYQSRADLQIGWVDGSSKSGMADFAYLAAMRTARRWVVCPTLADAEEVKAYLTEERILEAAQTDKFVAFPVSEVRQLFPI